MSYLIVACSLNPESRSLVLAQHAEEALRQTGATVDFMALKKNPLPLCDGDSVYTQPEVISAAERIQKAEGILLSVPIYNYDANAAAKNLIELTGKSWQDKVVGFLCAAGGQGYHGRRLRAREAASRWKGAFYEGGLGDQLWDTQGNGST